MAENKDQPHHHHHHHHDETKRHSETIEDNLPDPFTQQNKRKSNDSADQKRNSFNNQHQHSVHFQTVPLPHVHRHSFDEGRHVTKLSENAEQDPGTGEHHEKKMDKTVEMIEGHVVESAVSYSDDDYESSVESKPRTKDTIQMLKSAHSILLMSQQKQKEKEAWDNENVETPTEEYSQKIDNERLRKLRKDRGHCITYSLLIIYHLTVIASFLLSFYDSARITMENSKLQTLHLHGVFNCLDLIDKGEWIDDLVNIFHAMMSACVLYADSRTTAGLCIAYVFSQALHTGFKGYQFLMQLRFESGTIIAEMSSILLLIIICNILTSIVVIQRFYDLTDRIHYRAKYLVGKVSDGASLNDEIIYQNQSTFLQRKQILREAIAHQVFKVIRKLGKGKGKGKKKNVQQVDYLQLYKQLHAARMAISDMSTENVENKQLMKKLKKACARRLREIEANPDLVKVENGSDYQSLLLVKFSDRI